MANRRKAERLRTVAELYPEIVDADAGEDELLGGGGAVAAGIIYQSDPGRKRAGDATFQKPNTSLSLRHSAQANTAAHGSPKSAM
jgi:hypothetical protein